MSIVRVHGIDQYVEWIDVAGAPADSPALIFLHDSLGATSTWRDFPRQLADRVQLRAMSYDRRGYGRSAPFADERRTPAYLEDEARALIALMDVLRIQRAALFGHSDGGSIALIAAALAPDRILAAVTEGAHVFVEERTLDGIRAARQTFATTDLAERLARHHQGKVGGVVSAWIDTWLMPEYRGWNIEHYLPRVQCPVLAIQGGDDEYGTPAQVDAIVAGAAPRARGLMILGVGHTPHRDAAELVLGEAAELIRRAVRVSLDGERR